MRYAMAANFQHLGAGSKPTKDDQAKAILKMAETMDFGYDSKSVVERLQDWGIKCSDRYIRQVTKDLRASIDSERDAEIVLLKADGMTIAQIAETVGCGTATVERVTSPSKRNSSEMMEQPKTPSPSSVDEGSCPFDDDEPTLENTGFDLDDEDDVSVINPTVE